MRLAACSSVVASTAPEDALCTLTPLSVRPTVAPLPVTLHIQGPTPAVSHGAGFTDWPALCASIALLLAAESGSAGSTFRVVVGSAVIDASGKLRGPVRVTAPGLFEENDTLLQREAEAEFAELLMDLPAALRVQDAAFTDAARAGLRRIMGKRFGKRPLVEAHIMRI